MTHRDEFSYDCNCLYFHWIYLNKAIRTGQKVSQSQTISVTSYRTLVKRQRNTGLNKRILLLVKPA